MSSQLEAVVLEGRKKDKDHVTLCSDLQMISGGSLYSVYLLSYLKQYTQNPDLLKTVCFFHFNTSSVFPGGLTVIKSIPDILTK